jgi:hypothetical protein
MRLTPTRFQTVSHGTEGGLANRLPLLPGLDPGITGEVGHPKDVRVRAIVVAERHAIRKER